LKAAGFTDVRTVEGLPTAVIAVHRLRGAGVRLGNGLLALLRHAMGPWTSGSEAGKLMNTFTDKRGRKIIIEVDDCDAWASSGGREIGRVTTTGRSEIDHHTPPTAAEITGMSVDSRYRRAGIALEMLRLLSRRLGKLAPANRNEGRGGENALTDEGEALTRAAQDKGYVSPFPEDYPDDDN